MKAVGKQAGQIPDAVARNVSTLIAHAFLDRSVLVWLRDAILLCLDSSDFDKEKANIRSQIEHLDPKMLENLLSQCLSSGLPCDKVRSYIVEEYVRAKLEQTMTGCIVLRQVMFYDDTGNHTPCGEANLDVFAGGGILNTDQRCLSIDANKQCVGYECKVKLSSWLSIKKGGLDGNCKKKMDFMVCVAANLPKSSIRLASLEDGVSIGIARETLSAYGYEWIEVFSIMDI